MTNDPEEQTSADETLEDDTVVEIHTDSEDAANPGEADSAESGANEVPESAENELDKWRNLAHRNQAELENFRKRMARDKMDAIQYSNLGLLEELLPIIDNFEMGLTAAKNESEESMIFQGMNMVFKQMQNFLTEHGVETIEADNQTFDPNLHEALEQRHDDTVPEGDVIQQTRRGYKCKDRLLRASNVVVSKGPEA
ncbi:MAG: nucleotide exchange factor GrpE [Verrucomicrobia bacterium]|nr:nucleotide exchange factor GrpE [Verrucomicrobiota bacterium]